MVILDIGTHVRWTKGDPEVEISRVIKTIDLSGPVHCLSAYSSINSHPFVVVDYIWYTFPRAAASSSFVETMIALNTPKHS
jgi:hypothetical protein